jgi:hypothetical protein
MHPPVGGQLAQHPQRHDAAHARLPPLLTGTVKVRSVRIGSRRRRWSWSEVAGSSRHSSRLNPFRRSVPLTFDLSLRVSISGDLDAACWLAGRRRRVVSGLSQPSVPRGAADSRIRGAFSARWRATWRAPLSNVKYWRRLPADYRMNKPKENPRPKPGVLRGTGRRDMYVSLCGGCRHR